MRCIYGIFGREITKYTVIYGAYIRFWPTLQKRDHEATVIAASCTAKETHRALRSRQFM
jgi:hypothetical protein